MQNTLLFGTIIRGRYLVQETLGKGAFGAVYLLRDQHNNLNLLVLKEVINPNKHKLYQLSIEGMSLRLLHHPALPHVYNVISEGKQDRVYILMDYIDGPKVEMLRLQQLEKRFSLPQVMTIMLPIMEAVTYLHSRQPPIIHQDIKPTNVIVPTTSDKAVLVDYGIGKKYNLDSTSPTLDRSLTSYQAPEQYSEEPSTRTDIYGLGATFYTLLTGIVPVDALSRKIQLESKGSDPLEPVNKVIPNISLPVTESIQRAMSLSSNERFSTVEQFAQALQVDPAWKLSPVEKREFDLALKAAPMQQLSPEPIAVSSPPSSPMAAEQEEVIPAVVVKEEGIESVSEPKEIAPVSMSVANEEESRPAAKPEGAKPASGPVVRSVEVTPEAEAEESRQAVEPVAHQEEAKPVPEPVVKEEEGTVASEPVARPIDVIPEPEAVESRQAPEPVAQQEEAKPVPELIVRPVDVIPEPEAEESRQAPEPVVEPEETKSAPEPVVKEEESKVAPEPELIIRQIRLMPEPGAQQEEARPAPELVLREEEIRPVPAPISRQLRNAPSRKPGVPVLVLLALLIVGAVFTAYAVDHYSPVSLTSTPSPLPKATSSIHTPSSTRVATTSVTLVGSYNGTIYNVATNVTTKMSLTGIQQNQTAISGNFTGFSVNAPFKGSIDISRHIRFTVIDSSRSTTLSFDGVMQTDGNLAGSYCNLDQQGACSGGYGVWSVAPVHSHE